MDNVTTILKFPETPKGSWLRGLLKQAHHENFLVSGPWTSAGRPLGQFSSSLDHYSLLLSASGVALRVRSLGTQEHSITNREELERAAPGPVLKRFAEDLGSEQLWHSVRRALTEQVSMRPSPPTTPPAAIS